MAIDANRCEQSRIDRLLNGKLPADERLVLEQHLEACESCRQQLDDQTAEPAWWQDVRLHLSDEPSDLERLGSTQLPPGQDSNISLATDEPASSDIDRVLEILAPTDDPQMLGRLGPYEVMGVVGSGGMGVVLKGLDTALNRCVAIKVLAPHLATSGAARQRFAREAQAAAAVVHESVIEIYGVAEFQGLPYLVMPYVRGRSLQARINDKGPLELVEVLRVGAQTASGLAAAHEQGLVHRDIKPANILLGDGVERVKITDFGLARAVDDASVTRTGLIAGTPQFMSPEQARGESVDHRSDLFSLGSVLYTMCTGRPPFRAESSFGVLRRITDTPPRRIRELNPQTPDWLCRLIDKLHAKSPAERYQSAAEVADLLGTCLAHVQQPDAHPLPDSLNRPDKEYAMRQRRRILAGAVSVCLVAAGLLLGAGPLGNDGTKRTSNESLEGPIPTANGVADEGTTERGASEVPTVHIPHVDADMSGLEARVLEAMRANRLKLPQRGAMEWTLREISEWWPSCGTFQQWWDDSRIATRSTYQSFVELDDGTSRPALLGWRTAYDGNLFRIASNTSKGEAVLADEPCYRGPYMAQMLPTTVITRVLADEPRYRGPCDNWFEVIGWTRKPDFVGHRRTENLQIEWDTTQREGRNVVKRTVVYKEEPVVIVQYFDLERGGEQFAEERYRRGELLHKEEQTLTRLPGSAWLPTRVVHSELNPEGGVARDFRELGLNLEACSFGQTAKIPEGAFDLPRYQHLELPSPDDQASHDMRKEAVRPQFVDEEGSPVAGAKVERNVHLADQDAVVSGPEAGILNGASQSGPTAPHNGIEPAVGIDLTVDDVITGLRATEEAIESLMVNYRSQQTLHFCKPGTPLPANVRLEDDAVTMKRDADVSWEVTRDGCGRMSAVIAKTNVQVDGTERLRHEEFVSAFDGRVGRYLWTKTSPDHSSPFQQERVTQRFRHSHTSPFDLTLHHSSRPMSEVLTDQRAAIAGMQEWEDRPVVVVEIAPVSGSEESTWRYRYWVDADRNAVVRRQTLVRRGDDTPWELAFQLDATEHGEAAAGIWLPKVVETWAYQTAEGHPRYLHRREHIEFAGWTVNKEIDPSRFELGLHEILMRPALLGE